MHFQVEMKENSRKNIFTDNQTINKKTLMFLDGKGAHGNLTNAFD